MKITRVGGTEVCFAIREHAERYVISLAAQHRGSGPCPSLDDLVDVELLVFVRVGFDCGPYADDARWVCVSRVFKTDNMDDCGRPGWGITAIPTQATAFTEEDAVAFILVNQEHMVVGAKLWVES